MRIRAVKRSDPPLLRDFFAGLSPRSTYWRLFDGRRDLSDVELKSLTEHDIFNNVVLAATLRSGRAERIVGLGRYHRLVEGGSLCRSARLMVVVSDDHQGKGIGSALLDHLVRIAQENEISEFQGDVLGGNNSMLKLFSRSGFQVQAVSAGGVMHVSLSAGSKETLQKLRDEREWRAAADTIGALLNPRSVALVGASRDPASVGGELLRNIAHGEFKGEIFPINPNASAIGGLRCVPSVSSISRPVDLAVIALPAALVEDAINDCSLAGVKSLVVISSGFAEMSAEGRECETRLLELVRASGMRMVGPNCLGIMNTDPAVALNATFAPQAARRGCVAMLSQSGGLGLALLDYAEKLNLGLSSFVSAGNKADLSSNDYLRYWAGDEATKVIALYLESFGSPRKFSRIAPQVARRKPIVAVKGGRTKAGMRAACSHSASLAAPDLLVDALFEESGVIRAETLEELFDVVMLLSSGPLPGGRRVGVVTNAGGPGILLADALEARGLELPGLSDATKATLQEFLAGQAGLANPVDLTGSCSPEQFRQAIEVVGRSEAVDAVIVIYIPPFFSQIEEICSAVAQGAGMVPPDKPVAVVFISSKSPPRSLFSGCRGPLPCYGFPENAARAVAAAWRYSEWRAKPEGEIFVPNRFQISAVRAVIDRAKTRGGGWLSEEDMAVLLGSVGIKFASFEITTEEFVGDAASRLGYPVVAKAVVAGRPHKSDYGGVVLGLQCEKDVERAVQMLRERVRAIGARFDGVMIQQEVKSGIEAIAGVTADSTFGPVVLAGFGGVQVELIKDVSYKLPPVSDVDAEEMLGRLRCAALLDGYRGGPAADRPAFKSLLMRLSALCELIPEMRECDLNPIKLLSPGEGVVVVDARMKLGA